MWCVRVAVQNAAILSACSMKVQTRKRFLNELVRFQVARVVSGILRSICGSWLSRKSKFESVLKYPSYQRRLVSSQLTTSFNLCTSINTKTKFGVLGTLKFFMYFDIRWHLTSWIPAFAGMTGIWIFLNKQTHIWFAGKFKKSRRAAKFDAFNKITLFKIKQIHRHLTGN